MFSQKDESDALAQQNQLTINKRTHASTLYKAMAAKNRLEELEGLTMPSKRVKNFASGLNPHHPRFGLSTAGEK
jgi:hypothetical protein